MVVGNLGLNRGIIGVHPLETQLGDSDLRGCVNRFDVKYVDLEHDTIRPMSTLKWNDESVVREYNYGPKSKIPRFGVEGDFFLTDRIKKTEVVAGKMNKAGDIVELSKFDVDAVKEMRKDFPHVERFLRKISKFILR